LGHLFAYTSFRFVARIRFDRLDRDEEEVEKVNPKGIAIDEKQGQRCPCFFMYISTSYIRLSKRDGYKDW
jgi:hypothetical protein